MAFFQAETLWVNQLADGVACLVLDVPGRSVNVLSRRVLDDLSAALDRVGAASTFDLLIVRSGKAGSFIAGADLHEFARVTTAAEATAISETGQRLFDRLAALPIPTVAMISGACLGGGLELALACDYRVVVDDPRTLLGLPEIELGLVPGWGGTQRLPRTVGLERAFQIILGGRRLNARDAVRWGLADSVARDAEDGPPAFLANPVKRPRPHLPLHTWRQRLLEGTRWGRWLLYRGTERVLRRRLPDDMPAPREALRAVRTGIADGFAAGLASEREAIGNLATTTACRNLVRVFFQREEARKPRRDLQRDDSPPIRRVGVVGIGTMGAGIAQLAALKGCEVVVREVNETALAAGILRILALFRRAVERGVLKAEELPSRLAAIHGTTAWKGFADLDVVVEAIVEDAGAKQAIFKAMEENTSPSTILATNTSSLLVRQMQEGLTHPGRVAGLHFFNPVHKMPLVEVVRAAETDGEVAARLADWAVALGKTPAVVKDSPGFLVNRVLMPYLNEAVLLVVEGMRVQLIDEAMRRFGMPMGPLELLDQIGLDVAAHVAADIGPVFGARFGPSAGFEHMRENGWLGQKSGVGFYRYRDRRKKVNDSGVAVLRGTSHVAAPHQLDAAPPAELMATARERMVLLMVNEAAACLAEGLAESAEAIDLAMVLGTGWAPHRGGPLRYAEERGLGAVVDALTELAERYGPRFTPCAGLRRMVAVEPQASGERGRHAQS
jgi:3-hydroxyacyl-CoA dehydrogenase/enoyl-CoA hydratase/3-hydroxybutyryl-CoA epimerase